MGKESIVGKYFTEEMTPDGFFATGNYRLVMEVIIDDDGRRQV